MAEQSIQDMRSSYDRHVLHSGDLSLDPLMQTKTWFDKAVEIDPIGANAMTLATVGQNGNPSTRIVLLKGIDEKGLVFYTNYYSRKAREIEINPNAALLFFWGQLEQQIRIEGIIEKVSKEESKEYFQSRPKGSQIGAWASHQSKVLGDRSELEDRISELEGIYKDYKVLPLPAHWGGYRMIPHYYEFWQGRPDRLHDRFEYKLENDKWVINRLAP